jgi:hypothetical protein
LSSCATIHDILRSQMNSDRDGINIVIDKYFLPNAELLEVHLEPFEIAIRANVADLVISAKKDLADRDFSAYWNTVYGIVALIGGLDLSDDEEDDYIDMVNLKLGGPGT